MNFKEKMMKIKKRKNGRRKDKSKKTKPKPPWKYPKSYSTLA